jgi:hypothetical protein
MRKSTFACVAVATVICGGPVGAADQTDGAQPVAFEYDAYYRQGDAYLTSTPVANHATTASSNECCEPACGDVCCGDSCGCGCACGAGGILSDYALAGPIEGFSLACLIGADGTGLDIGGWTETVYMDNNVPLSQAYNDGSSFDDVPDHAHIGQQWFYVGHEADGSGGWGLGGRMDVLYGTDAQKTQGFGNPGSAASPPGTFFRNAGTFDASWDHGEYGWAMPQLYGEVAYGDLSVKIGHFFTPLGYEVVPATGNFFRSHSYTLFNSQPLTHTGVLSTYTGFEYLTLYGGWSAGWDTGFDQLNQGNIAIGGFAYQIAEDVTFTYMNTYGNFGWRDGGDENSYSHTAVLTVGLTDNLQYIAENSNVRTDNPGISAFDTVGLNQYLIYKFNDFVSTGGRVEWWKADGVSFYEATGGFNFHLLDNLVLRPEMRQDWSPGAGIDEDTFLVDAIWTY